MKRVNVMLSTYNGERFLRDQAESILNQTGVEVRVFVRDDGSSDRTKKILSSLDDDRISVDFASNVGWRKSFFHLLWTVPISVDEYYAFADQDDIWKPEKLIRAIQLLSKVDGPALYHSNMTLVDSKLKFIGNKYPTDFVPSDHMPQSFFDGVGTGSTMVMNGRLLSLIRVYQPNDSLSHDAYVMALANLLGQVVYDSESFILYRRHEGNATGFGKNQKINNPSIVARFKRYHKLPSRPYSIRAQQLLSGYQRKLNSSDALFLTEVARSTDCFRYRVKLFLSPGIRASTFKKTLAIKYRILVNTL